MGSEGGDLTPSVRPSEPVAVVQKQGPDIVGAVDADSTNQILRGVVEGVIEENLDLGDEDLAREIVNTLRKQGWIRGRAERRRAIERNRREDAGRER